MNTLTRFAIAALVIAASLQNVNAVQPRSLAERRAEMRTRILEAQTAKLAAFNQREKDFYSGKRRKFMYDLRSSLTCALLSDKSIPYVLSHESDPLAAKNAEYQADTVSMGCCFSKEDDRFDANESLLPKGKQVYVHGVSLSSHASAKILSILPVYPIHIVSRFLSRCLLGGSEKSAHSDFDHVDLAKKAAGAGSYKSPELSLHQHRPNNHHSSHDHGHDNGHDHGYQRQQHAKEKKDAATTHQPAPMKAPAVVESVDLLGLTKPASPPAAAPTLSADVPVFRPPHQAVPPPQVAALAAPTKPVSPPKLPPTPAIAAQDAKPPTASTGKSTSPPKPTEPKEPAKADPPARTPSAPVSVATTGDMDSEENDDNSEKAPSLSASTSMKKTNKKKKKVCFEPLLKLIDRIDANAFEMYLY
ncbi:hypothetical protein FI667_g2776, partial [Globisporangium splendens]